MQTTILLFVRIALLILLWLFIWVTIRAIIRDASSAATGLPLPVAGGAELVPGALPTTLPPAVPGAPEPRRGKTPHRIVITSGPLTGSTLELEHYTDITIGRGPSCTFVLEDDFASSLHARLQRSGSEWYIDDVDSRNGTWIGLTRIDQPTKLSAGTEFRVGQTHLRMDA